MARNACLPSNAGKESKMQVDTAAPTRVTLDGEWTMNGAAERLELLAGQLAMLLEADPRPTRVDLELAGVANIDACGCQLLAVFLENLKLHGITPEPCGIAPEVREQITLLGFADAFTASGTHENEPQAAEKENT
jgi:anti-anti-sigma regulatory factor